MEPLLQETLQSRDFSGEDLLKIQAEHCQFVSCIFEDALLEHCRFSECVFRFCEFSGTMLRQCVPGLHRDSPAYFRRQLGLYSPAADGSQP